MGSLPTSSRLRHTLDRRALIAAAAGAGVALAVGRSVVGQTPVPVSGGFAERLGTLLGMVPALDLDPEILLPFHYADIETQMAATGVDLPDAAREPVDVPEGFIPASMALPLAPRAYQYALNPEWFRTFGFAPFGVHQVMSLGEPPDTITIYSGGIEGATVEAALERSGYQMILQETGGHYWTVGDDIDITSSVGQLGVGAMNHAAAYGHTVVFAHQEARLQAVTQTVAGLAPSMLEQGIWSIMAMLFPSDIVGLVPVSAAILDRIPAPAGAGVSTLKPVAGQVEWMAFGVRAGSIAPPSGSAGDAAAGVPAQVEVRFRYSDADLAASEAAVIPERWGSLPSLRMGQPYSELMDLQDARVHRADARVVAVSFSSQVPNRYLHMVQAVDLTPFVPGTWQG